MSSDAADWAVQELRRALRKKAAEDEPGAIPETLSAPTKETLAFLVDFLTAYRLYGKQSNVLPDDYRESVKYRWLMDRLESQLAHDANMHGKSSVMRGISGRQDERIDASSFPFLKTVEELFKPDDRDHMLNLVIYAPPPPVGPTGVGKTDFGYSVIDAARMIHPGGLTVASNNTSDPFEDVESWTELEAWLEATDGTKLFLWDEAAQVLQFDDIDSGRELSRLIKLLRKYDCHLIVIGHTGKDIPKDIRRMVLFALKESKKKAVIGAGLKEDNVGWMQIKNVLYRLNNIRATTIEYDSIGDKGRFVFDREDAVDARADPGDDVDDTYHQCQATTKKGDQCGKEARYPRGEPIYCGTHRSKLNDDENDD
ncbi:hypothetical protein [Haloferax sulfurifontis]|uniref:Uncharacterized protein n=1 Tax=Haloferax sulfurifontis TaxID=255616 RepID=A0A830E3G8_9EURY|nr:hypothetical protein [Haloferax sulfurifontis]GGC49805.1 hypothetical protein GCM10007209_09350 [Haloferax sulfurifontis]